MDKERSKRRIIGGYTGGRREECTFEPHFAQNPPQIAPMIDTSQPASEVGRGPAEPGEGRTGILGEGMILP